MITIETIRALEAAAATFEKRIDFSRHVTKTMSVAYDGVELCTGGGLLRSDEAIAIDTALLKTWADAGYEAEDEYELAKAIWNKVQG